MPAENVCSCDDRPIVKPCVLHHDAPEEEDHPRCASCFTRDTDGELLEWVCPVCGPLCDPCRTLDDECSVCGAGLARAT